MAFAAALLQAQSTPHGYPRSCLADKTISTDLMVEHMKKSNWTLVPQIQEVKFDRKCKSKFGKEDKTQVSFGEITGIVN